MGIESWLAKEEGEFKAFIVSAVLEALAECGIRPPTGPAQVAQPAADASAAPATDTSDAPVGSGG
jgi:hypothetical protein